MSTKNGNPDTITWPDSPQTEEEVIRFLKTSPMLYRSYQNLSPTWKQDFLDFCRGKKSLPLTYDPFFKQIFHPDIHPDRLSRLISSLLGIEMKVVDILPTSDSILNGNIMFIMDILARLEDGSYVDVEIQKSPYPFPAERISCYISDLIMRQYSHVRGIKGLAFHYQDIKKVYVIVIYEKSPEVFHEVKEHYIHHGGITFNTGLKLELLQKCCLIALDVFRQFPYPKDRNEQTAWLSLLATENLEDAEALIQEYPWLEEIYAEMAMLRQRPEEVLGMFSEALRILDQNTMQFMIDEMQKTIDDKDATIDTIKTEKAAAVREKETAVKEKEAIVEKNKALLEEINALKKQLAQRSS